MIDKAVHKKEISAALVVLYAMTGWSECGSLARRFERKKTFGSKYNNTYIFSIFDLHVV
jgi:hypothetical protein